jgi:hypothetical protein
MPARRIPAFTAVFATWPTAISPVKRIEIIRNILFWFIK